LVFPAITVERRSLYERSGSHEKNWRREVERKNTSEKNWDREVITYNVWPPR
jgi:hypothetical protein